MVEGRPIRGRAVHITKREIERLQRSAKNARAQIARAREEGREIANTVLTGAAVSGTAFAVGAINGRYGDPEVVGIPLGLVVGAVGHVGGFVLGKDGGAQLHAVGDGGLGAYLSDLGRSVGARMASESAMLTPGE